MRTIAIVHNHILPLPAVKGGGIETLIESLIKENEEKKKVKFLIFSPYDRNAEIESKKYKYSKFIYIKTPYLLHAFFRLLVDRFLHRILRLNYLIDYAHYFFAYRKVKKEKIDVLIFDSLSCAGYKMFKKIAPNNMIYYSHVFEKPDTPVIMYDRVITISEFCKKPWLKWLDNDKISVLRNGINLNEFNKDFSVEERNVMRNKFSVSEEDFLLIYCGRIVESKGVKELIDAVLGIDDYHIKLMIVGDFKESVGLKSEYISAIKNNINKACKRVFLTGYIKNNELYKYYKMADLQVVPSICEEAAGLVAIEGMACGLPLIVTNSGGMPEYVGDKAAIVIDKDDNMVEKLKNAILEIKDNPQKKEKLSFEGRKRALMFGSSKYYENFINSLR